MTEKNNSQLVIYQTEAGETKIDVRFQDETVWLSQQLMAELFQTSIPNINMHIKNVFDEEELSPKGTIKKFLIVRSEGGRQVSRKVDFFNLDMIISVGYRIKSRVATHFRLVTSGSSLLKDLYLMMNGLKIRINHLIILMNCCAAFRIFVLLKDGFIKK